MQKIHIAFALLVLSCAVNGGALDETRYGSRVSRDEQGVIIRRSDVLRAFQQIHPCPSTGLRNGKCGGWSKNHVIPLACGGEDSVSNLQWLPNVIKTCADKYCVDRFERKIYDNNIAGADNCKNTIIGE